MKLLICFGTRPEWIKLLPIISLLNKKDYKLLFTGQHTDLLKHVQFDYSIKIDESNSENNRLNQIISDCLNQFPDDTFDGVMVQGDTSSAYACALAAFNRKIKVYHVEAGLRSYDLENPYPEEAYRQMISRISNVNFCPTILSHQHLTNEKVSGKSFVAGNTALDNLIKYKNCCEYTHKILVTLHRRENHNKLDMWFKELNCLARENPHLNFILPIHPNPNVQKHKNILKYVNVVEPMVHIDLIELMVKCKLIITDSGGLQEEGSFFNKKVIVCRETTERPEGIQSGHLYMCSHPNKLYPLFDMIKNDYIIDSYCPYGDGHAAQKIIDILFKL